jgi:TRAP transporter TAXI family solute receptor
MVAVSELAQRYLKIKATAIATAPGSAAGIQGIKRKELDFAPLLDQTVWWAMESIGPFKGKPPLKTVRAVVGNHLLLYGLVTTADSGIKSMDDLRGSGYTISIHPAGSTTLRMFADGVLEFYNLGAKDVKAVPHTGVAEVTSGLKEKRFKVVADALYASVSMPWALELDRDIELRMIPLSKECIKYVINKVEGTVSGNVPPGLYSGVEENIPTVGIAAGVFCSVDLPDSFVYELTKLIFNEPTRKIWLGYGTHHKEYMADKINDFLTPVHSGAISYYKESGVWTDAHEERQQDVLNEIGMGR